MILGLVGKMGGFEAVPGLGVETCRCLLELLLLLFAMVELLLDVAIKKCSGFWFNFVCRR